MSTLRWGILGTGWIAGVFTGDLLENEFDVVAVGSRSEESAEKFAGEHGIAKAHGSYEALVADPEVDAIYVATPHPFHAEHATLALEAGKHVLVEKPFTLNAVQAAAVVELAASRNLVVLEAMWTRFLPTMARVRAVIEAGTLGQVTGLVAGHMQALPLDPTHRLQDPKLGGGALLDLGIYPISFAWDLFGAPTDIAVVSSPTPTGVDGRDTIALGYEGGQQASIHIALDTNGDNGASVLGTEGRIELDDRWYEATGFTVYDRGGQVVERFDKPATPGRGMHYQAEELERIVGAGKLGGELLPPEETVAIMATLDAIRGGIGLRYPGE